MLTRPGYYTKPSLDELAQQFTEQGHCRVENLVIGREGYGNVFFFGETDVTGLNLDDLGTSLSKKTPFIFAFVWVTLFTGLCFGHVSMGASRVCVSPVFVVAGNPLPPYTLPQFRVVHYPLRCPVR